MSEKYVKHMFEDCSRLLSTLEFRSHAYLTHNSKMLIKLLLSEVLFFMFSYWKHVIFTYAHHSIRVGLLKPLQKCFVQNCIFISEVMLNNVRWIVSFQFEISRIMTKSKPMLPKAYVHI